MFGCMGYTWTAVIIVLCFFDSLDSLVSSTDLVILMIGPLVALASYFFVCMFTGPTCDRISINLSFSIFGHRKKITKNVIRLS